MIIDGVVARPRVDDVGGAAAVDGVRAGAARDDIGARVAGQRDACRQRGGVDVLEMDDLGGPADDLIVDIGEIDRRGGLQRQRIGSGPAVQRDFGSMIGDDVIAGARVDDVGAAAAVDGVVARAARDDVRAARTRDRNARRQKGRVDILEVDDVGRVARCLIADIGEIDDHGGLQHERVHARAAVDNELRAVIVDDVVAAASMDDVVAAAAVDGVVARARDDDIGAGRTGDLDGGRENRRAQVLEIRDVDGVARRLIGAGGGGEIDGGDPARGVEDQRVASRTAVDGEFASVVMDGVVAAAGGNHIGPAAAVDGVAARSAGEDIDAARPRDGDARQ